MKYQDMVDHHIGHGYWSSANDQRYGYILCPEPFFLERTLHEQLVAMGKTVATYVRGCKDVFMAAEQLAGRDRSASWVYSMCKQAAGGLPVMHDGRDIPITKVDCMIDQQGNIQIAEVDAYNPRGIPFALFLRDTFNDLQNPLNKLSDTLVAEAQGKDLLWVHAHRERYYQAIFTQMKRIMAGYGVTVSVADATSATVISDQKIVMIPWGMDNSMELSVKAQLVAWYEKSPQRFIYPLLPWLGSKGLLAFASNGAGNQLIEAFINDHAPELKHIREFVPSSVLIGKQFACAEQWLSSREAFVLKKHVSSGLKGVWVVDKANPEFATAKTLHRTAYCLQDYVQQKTFSLPYFADSSTVKTDDWYVRLTAYIAADGTLLDAEVTGRRSPDVHGALDCIQLPCVLR